jgi:hypothetical protein
MPLRRHEIHDHRLSGELCACYLGTLGSDRNGVAWIVAVPTAYHHHNHRLPLSHPLNKRLIIAHANLYNIFFNPSIHHPIQPASADQTRSTINIHKGIGIIYPPLVGRKTYWRVSEPTSDQLIIDI